MAVIQEAWIGGVSTRRVDELVQAMGLTGISKSTVSKLCRDIDERVRDFPDRPPSGDWPRLWLDATYLKTRQGGRIVSVAAIIAAAVNADGRREIVGLSIGPSEAETFRTDFLRSLKSRSLSGVKLVISDAHRPQGSHRTGVRGDLVEVSCSLDAECARSFAKGQHSIEDEPGSSRPSESSNTPSPSRCAAKNRTKLRKPPLSRAEALRV